jgi:hypothetical protein
MYAVVRYFNYRKDVSFKILKTFKSVEKADNYAYECAKNEFGENMTEGVMEEKVYVDTADFASSYTNGDGYDKFVFTVIEIEEPEMQEKMGGYEWGFDLTSFVDENDFQELLNKFDMELVSKKDREFLWEDKGSILMVTSNDPLSGEKGYLGYVGIRCKSPERLQEFINEFKKKACYIKGESNRREYI